MNRTQSIALVRALAAVSWADGRLERAEESHLKRLAYRLGLAAGDLHQHVQPLLEQPLSYERAMQEVGELLAVLGSAADRDLFRGELRELFAADGTVSPEEERMLAEIEAALAEYGTVDFLLGKLRGVFGALLPARRARAAAPGAAAPGDAAFAPFAKNRLLPAIVEQLRARGDALPLAPAELNRAALAGAMFARVARAGDRRIDERELGAMRRALGEHAGLSGEALEVVLAVVTSGSGAGMDRQRLCAEYNRVSELAERRRLVAAMFGVAGPAPPQEVRDEIRLLANFLWLPTREFVELRRRWAAGAGGAVA